MSVYNEIYNALASGTDLSALLGLSVLDETSPAIYEKWAAEGAAMPYINLSFNFSEGFHWAKEDGLLTVDIFTENDTVLAEKIRNQVWYLLDRQQFESIQDGLIRVYAASHEFVEEDTPEVTHIEMIFSVKYWRKHVIERL